MMRAALSRSACVAWTRATKIVPAHVGTSAHFVRRRNHHTIYALATGPPPTAIAIIRVSGPAAGSVLAAMLQGQRTPRHGEVALRTLYNPHHAEADQENSAAQTGVGGIASTSPTGSGRANTTSTTPLAPLDRGVVIWWAAPRSYTGEDVVELHLHGGAAVVRAVSEALSACDGVRPAAPGEFTRRAFRNGKMDLTQAEGIHDLVAAETEAQRVQALRYVSAEAELLYEGWRTEILRAMAHIEAFIDFGDDEGIEDDVMQSALERLSDLRARMSEYLAGAGCGERLRNGVRVAVVGQPNVGKSSLMNYLVGREASIVADRPGTTRDVIEVTGDVGGYPVAFIDTAGIRHAPALDPVEVEGVRRAEAAAAAADLRLCVQDAAAGPDALCPAGSPTGTAVCRCKLSGSARTVVVLNKMDLVDGGNGLGHQRATRVASPDADGRVIADMTVFGGDGAGAGDQRSGIYESSNNDGIGGIRNDPVFVSCETRSGLRELVARLQDEVAALCGGGGVATGPVVQARHRAHLADCITAIDRVLDDPVDVVVAAEELRVAAEQFGYITGRFDNETVLDVVFAEFCIGK